MESNWYLIDTMPKVFLHLFVELNPMKLTDALPLAFGVSKGSEYVPDDLIARCSSFKAAVRLCWAYRRIQGMTKRTLAERAGLYPSHVSDYLSLEESKRDLPADCISSFEAICGNRAITQWEMRQRGLTIMEEVIAKRAA